MVEEKNVERVIDQVLRYLKKKLQISKAFLFGSYVEGKPDEWSDIDIAIFSPDVEDWSIEQKAELATSVKLNCHDHVEVHIFPEDALSRARPTNFYGYIIENGRKIA